MFRVVVLVLLASCAQQAPSHRSEAPKDAFRQFDPPPPGPANRPELGLGGKY